MSIATTSTDRLDVESATVIVVGSGIAGLSAAVAAAEELAGSGTVVVLDRATESEAGGNTKWTDAYFRMGDVYEPAENFAEDIIAFSGGRAPRDYVSALLERLPDTMEWVQSHGARFESHGSASYFVNSVKPRLRPRGGGEGLRLNLRAAALELGVIFRYQTVVDGLIVDDGGRVLGVEGFDHTASDHSGPDQSGADQSGAGPSGTPVRIRADAVVIASGGFEGNTELLTEQLGGDASTLRPIAPSTAGNRGEGILAALAVGARKAGQWDTFHAEPVDLRSSDPEALVMVFPYGLLLTTDATRFVDEGRGTVDEIYEKVARTIWSEHAGQAWFVTDQQLERVTEYRRGILTSVKPMTADSLEGLAEQTGLPLESLRKSIDDFNAATPEDGVDRFDWRVADGVSTTGLEPPKSNWALPLHNPPYLAYPVGCAIVFTFGGLATDIDGRVLKDDGSVIAGLYAAGECTGLYHEKYTGGTSVLRGMIFGRAAGTDAARATASSVLH